MLLCIGGTRGRALLGFNHRVRDTARGYREDSLRLEATLVTRGSAAHHPWVAEGVEGKRQILVFANELNCAIDDDPTGHDPLIIFGS